MILPTVTSDEGLEIDKFCVNLCDQAKLEAITSCNSHCTTRKGDFYFGSYCTQQHTQAAHTLMKERIGGEMRGERQRREGEGEKGGRGGEGRERGKREGEGEKGGRGGEGRERGREGREGERGREKGEKGEERERKGRGEKREMGRERRVYEIACLYMSQQHIMYTTCTQCMDF